MGACNISIKCSHIGEKVQLDVSEHKIGSRENWHGDQPHFYWLSRWFRDEIYFFFFFWKSCASGKNNQECNCLKSEAI